MLERNRARRAGWAWPAAVLLAGAGAAQAQTVAIDAAADGTMYAQSGAIANGSGGWLFAGRIADGTRRRALLRFDLEGALPAGAQVSSATLELSMTRTIADALPFSLHRVGAAWGEASSDAGDPGGQGTFADPGDATWQFRFFPDVSWDAPGGDFETTASAFTDVGPEGRYTWSGPGLVDDVQAWLQDPAANHGWLLMADESEPGPTAKRWAARENADAALRPLLVIGYSTMPPSSMQPATIPTAGLGVLVLLAGLFTAFAWRSLRVD